MMCLGLNQQGWQLDQDLVLLGRSPEMAKEMSQTCLDGIGLATPLVMVWMVQDQ